MASTIAIIPARGGSKRIPRKNVVDFCGKPLIAWTIEAALSCDRFDRVIVSTDNEEIASIAKSYGVEVPFLRVEAADDISPVSEAVVSSLYQAEQFWGEEFDVVVQLMANCPLRGGDDIVAALDEFLRNDSDFLISAFKFGWMNPWWAAKLDHFNRPIQVHPEALGCRSQDLEKLYCPTGAIWIASGAALKKTKVFYGEGHVFFPVSWVSAVDIDDYDDLKMAKALFLMAQLE